MNNEIKNQVQDQKAVTMNINKDAENNQQKSKPHTLGTIDNKDKDILDHQQNKKNLFVQTNKPQQQQQNYEDLEQVDNKWEELKITGSNIMNRSYGSCSIYDVYFYVYGGYEVNLGILADFWKIKIITDQYKWEKVRVKNEAQGPGPRTRHTSTIYKNKLYIFGGQYKSQISTNSLFAFDFQDCTWEKVKQKGDIPPEIDSHCVVKTETGQMIVLLGYFSQLGEYSNAVFQYEFDTATWKQRFQQNFDHSNISGRVNSSAVLVKQSIYVFGGYDGQNRLNDLWQFNLQNNKWNHVQLTAPIIPTVRSGHSMTYYKNCIAIFGGIHDITHELDDLYLFNIEKSYWIEIDKCSSISRNKQSRPVSQDKNGNGENKSPQRNIRSRSKNRTCIIKDSPIHKRFDSKGPRQSLLKPMNNTSIVASQTTQGQFTILDQNDETNDNFDNTRYQQQKQFQQGGSPLLPQSPTKNIQEKKKREFLQQKAEMLKLFETKFDFLDKNDTSPTSEAMKNSLARIGNPNQRIKVKPGKLTDFGKTTTSRFLEPLKDINKSKIGKKPCARDGQFSDIFKNKWIIFGGDRHKMSFNDIFSLDFEQFLGNVKTSDINKR